MYFKKLIGGSVKGPTDKINRIRVRIRTPNVINTEFLGETVCLKEATRH